MKKYNVLVTGANGFVGSNIVKTLLKNRFNIYALVRRTSDLSFLKPIRNKIKLVYGDIRDKDSLRHTFKREIDIVIHTAAYASDWGNYELFYAINVCGTKNICELALEYKIKHLIHISSISVYGFNKRINATEDTPVIKNSFPYCKSKLEGENTVRHFIKVFNLPATIVQPGIIYGPNDRTMSYKMIDALLKRRFGISDSGKHLLSPLYIENLMQAILLILKKPKISIGKTYIITDNIKITWAEFTNIFCKYLNAPFPWLNLPRFLAFIAAFFSESIYKLLMMKSPPLITFYRVALITSEFHFVPKKIMNELGYKPDTNIKRNIQKTIKAYFKYKAQ